MISFVKDNYGKIILFLIFIFLFIKLNKVQRERDIYQSNVEALKDVVRKGKTKNGDDEYLIKTLIAKNKRDLKKLNHDLYLELKKEFGDVMTISKTTTIIKYDTIKLNSEVVKYANGSNGIYWDYDTTYSKNNYKKLKGVTNFKLKNGEVVDVNSVLISDENGIEVVLGYKDNGNGIELFARSEHPYFKVNDIKSVIIASNDKILNKYSKGKALFYGPYLGIGLTSDLQIRPSIGFGVGFNLNR